MEALGRDLGAPTLGAREHLPGDVGSLGSSLLAAQAPDVEGPALGLRAMEPRQLLGEENLITYREPTMLTEDFGYFIEHVTGSFYHIGVRNPDVGAVHPLHSEKFTVDESAIPKAAALHSQIAFNFLSQEGPS